MSKTNLNKTLIYQLCNANNKFNYKLIVMNLFNFQKEHLFSFFGRRFFFAFKIWSKMYWLLNPGHMLYGTHRIAILSIFRTTELPLLLHVPDLPLPPHDLHIHLLPYPRPPPQGSSLRG